MMKVSHTIVFGHAVKVFYKDLFAKHGKLFHDLGVNPNLLPFSGVAPTGPARPSFHFNGEEFWMHGINVGLSVQF